MCMAGAEWRVAAGARHAGERGQRGVHRGEHRRQGQHRLQGGRGAPARGAHTAGSWSYTYLYISIYIYIYIYI